MIGRTRCPPGLLIVSTILGIVAIVTIGASMGTEGGAMTVAAGGAFVVDTLAVAVGRMRAVETSRPP